MKSYDHFLGQHAKNSQQKISYRQGAQYAAHSRCLGSHATPSEPKRHARLHEHAARLGLGPGQA